MKIFAFVFLTLFLFPPAASGQDEPGTDWDIGSGFVEVQSGWFVVLGADRRRMEDAFAFGLNLGFSLLKEFTKEDSESLTFGPKAGFIVGREKAINNRSFFWDAVLNVRYAFSQPGDLVCFYVEAGPGATSYGGKAFELLGTAGVNFGLGVGTFGVSAHYKEIIGSKNLDRGLAFMGSLGYPF